MSSGRRIAKLEARVAALLSQVERLTAEVERLKPFEARVAVLEAENAALKEKLSKSSRNSSKPPSSDGPKERAERRTKKPTGRAAGGQPGHPKHERPAWPSEKVSKRIELRPKECENCASPLVGEDLNPRRHQVFDLPKVEPNVTEFVQHSLECTCCGHVTRAPLPPGVPSRPPVPPGRRRGTPATLYAAFAPASRFLSIPGFAHTALHRGMTVAYPTIA